MRRFGILVVALSAGAVSGGAVLPVAGAAAGDVPAARAAVPAARAAVPAARAANPWGAAIEVPGLGALNAGGGAGVESMSCASAGNCAAAGHYTGRHGSGQGYVASEQHGRWGKAAQVPGLGALNVGGGADVLSVSCGSPGNCAAGGFYSWNVAYFRIAPFLVTEHAGRWGKAVALPRDGEVNSVSCASAGNCLAGGQGAPSQDYTDNGDAFIIQESAGRWGAVRAVPGLLALEQGDDSGLAASWINSVDCPSPGNCLAGGVYADNSGNEHGFVASEQNGVWGSAIEVPGLASLTAGGAGAQVSSVSCGSTGNCAAGGYYTDNAGHRQGFVASESSNAWSPAIEVPGLGARNTGHLAAVQSVSCGAAASCAAGGYYTGAAGDQRAFVTTDRDGVWGPATELPGLGALHADHTAAVNSVSCASAGNCAAGGYYVDGSRHRQGFMAVEHNGNWGTGTAMTRLEHLNAGGSAEVGSVSCATPGSCASGGSYTGGSRHHQGFVTQGG
jgi:hypothetical protein